MAIVNTASRQTDIQSGLPAKHSTKMLSTSSASVALQLKGFKTCASHVEVLDVLSRNKNNSAQPLALEPMSLFGIVFLDERNAPEKSQAGSLILQSCARQKFSHGF